MIRATFLLILATSVVLADESAVPPPVTAENYGPLLERPPFRQPLSLSDSLVLSGVARLPGGPVVTLWNRATGETSMVSSRPNAQGWRLVDLPEITDLKSVFAVVDTGTSHVTVRFDPERLTPPKLDNQAKPAKRTEAALVVEALLRTLDPDASKAFESLPAESQEKFRKSFSAYLASYPASTDEERRAFLQKALPASETPAPASSTRPAAPAAGQ